MLHHYRSEHHHQLGFQGLVDYRFTSTYAWLQIHINADANRVLTRSQMKERRQKKRDNPTTTPRFWFLALLVLFISFSSKHDSECIRSVTRGDELPFPPSPSLVQELGRPSRSIGARASYRLHTSAPVSSPGTRHGGSSLSGSSVKMKSRQREKHAGGQRSYMIGRE
jgi:hypothetical protein